MSQKRYWTYIVGGAGQTIYIGMTNDLMRRVYEHKTHAVRGFTSKYNLDRLLYFVEFGTPQEAIAHEKRLKGWVRRKKDALLDQTNSERQDLAGDWFDISSEGDFSVVKAPEA